MVVGRNGFGRRRARGGFTLVELLVVVSIIALLITILMPSLQKARRAAKRIACNSTIRAVALAGLTYSADDPQDNSIPVSATAATYATTRYTRFLYGGKSGVGGTGNNGGLNSLWGDSFGAGPADRPMNTVLYKSAFQRVGRGNTTLQELHIKLELGAYRCAGDKGFPGMHWQGWKTNAISGYDYFGNSYGCNPMWVYDPADPQFLWSNAMYLRPMSRVPNATNTIMFWEHAARFAMYARNDEDFGVESSTPPGQPPGGCRRYFEEADGFVAKGHHGEPWHFNIAFGDGHAQWLKIKSYGIALGNQVPADCAGSGGPSSRCICVLVRGRGWQLDTMPAPFVVSTYPSYGGPEVPEGSGEGDSDSEIVP